MKTTKVLSACCNVASIGVLAWMLVGGLITYTPRVSASDIQNIYLSRMMFYGFVSAALQIAAIVLTMRISTES
jgi:hypothetical protein